MVGEAKAKVAAAQMPYTHGPYGGLSFAVEKAGIEKTALKGCLAEKGYNIEWVEKNPA